MLHLAGSAPDNRPIFRIAYASRAAYPMPSGEVVTLAADAADKNRRNAVSGVLFSGDGVFVQWLEGPQDAVCPLMARIEADPRHRDVAILSSGWAPTRRYRRWPMRLAQTPVQANNARRRRGPFAPCDAPGAMAAFDAMAETHRRRDAQAAENAALHAAFANRLINAALEKPTRFPAWARDDLGARAQFVDDVCAAFMAGWRDDRWSSAEIGVGMAHLHRLWRRAGRAPDPAAAGRAVAIVVP
ncbi:MAG: BLUF domain-containing protein, partial [Pseudomonadota bacterium]